MFAIMVVFMIFGKAFAFCIFFLLAFSVQNSLALEDDDDDDNDERPRLQPGISLFSSKEGYEEWKTEQIKNFEKNIEKIKQVDTEDKYVLWFDGFFPPCEMGVWKEHMIDSYKSHIKDIKSLEFGGNGFSGGGGRGLPECLQGEYSYEKFNTLYDSRIHNVTNRSYRNSDYNANITAIVAPVTPVVEDNALEVDVSEEQNEPILLNGESTREAKQEKSFLKRLIDKIRNYIWAKD